MKHTYRFDYFMDGENFAKYSEDVECLVDDFDSAADEHGKLIAESIGYDLYDFYDWDELYNEADSLK